MNVAKRWQPLFSLLVMLVLVVLAVQPAGARPQASAPAAAHLQIPGKHGTSLRNGRTAAPLRELAARVHASGPIRDGRTINGTPYQGLDADGQAYTYYDLRQNLHIPRGQSRTGTLRPQNEASRPTTPPLKKIYDDPMPDLTASWEGLNQGSNRTNFTFGFLPPDTNGDSSGNVYDTGFYVQTVNTNFAVWDYSKVNVYGAWPKTVVPPTPMNTLFTGFGGACEATNDGDPIVLYDEQAGQWLMSQFALPVFDFEPNPFPEPFYQCIAISETGDPTGNWFLYEFGGLFQDMNDYPKFGIWNDGYYMTVNQFNATDFSWEGQGIMVFERDAMLAGDPAQWFYHDPYESCNSIPAFCFLGAMLPADNDGTPAPAGTPGYVVQFDDDAWGYSGDQLQVWSVSVDWVGGISNLVHEASLPVAAFDSEVCLAYDRNCIPQPGTAEGLDAISDRLMYRLQYRNFGDHQSMVTNHTVKMGAGQAGIRWYELRNTGPGWTVHQQGDFAPDTDNRWMGSIAMDQVGNMALGYSVSSSSTFPSIRYAGRLASDPLNTLPRTEVAIATGAGSQTSATHRWGDYSSMSVAPTGCDFIYTNQYLRGTTPAEWYTRMGNFSFDACWANDITPPDTTITSTPTNPSTGAVTFEFTGDDGVGGTGVDHFLCSLDNSPFDTCTSPKSYTGLVSGSHTFRVAAVDTVGNIDPTPASFTWTVVNTLTTFKSIGGQDGWVLESTEWSGVGGTLDSAATTFRVGDETGDRQYRSVLSFDTSTLPDTAVVTKVILKIRRQGLVGTDPFTILNRLVVDIRKGPFSTSALLQLEDFNAVASLSPAGIVPNAPVSGLYSSTLARAALPYVHLAGKTQLRLRFQKDDNDDLGPDYMSFYSGNAVFLSQQPSLIVEYYVP